MSEQLKILVKYPSRGRPERFFKSLDTVVNNAADPDNYLIAITLDDDDEKMNNSDVIERINSYKNVQISWGRSESKIHAINRDMPRYGDIIVNMADDMEFRYYGWDMVIREHLMDNLDMLLHLPDNDAGAVLATMYIAGRPFYERQGYIYNPIYKSLHCDNEIQAIAQKTGRYKFVNFTGVVHHLNMAYGHQPKDEMFIRQQEIGWSEDFETFNRRQAENFGL